MRAAFHQPNLFDAAPRADGDGEACVAAGPLRLLDDIDGGVTYEPGVVDPATAADWCERLRDGLDWQAMRRPMYDRVVEVPRLVCAYRLDADDLPPPLAEIAALLRRHLRQPFNTVGCNYYRDGADSVAPHNDKLDTLVPRHPIALLSLGATRRMTLRRKQPPRTPLHVDLKPGSVLSMSYQSQLDLDHGIPKTRETVGARISLAFRVRPAGHGSRLHDRSTQPARPPR